MQLTDKIQITNEDNMLLMARYPDNYFDLAIVDPPYGMGDVSKFTPRKTNCAKNKIHKETKWNDETPKDEYWAELFRVSKNQIIWGGNYFALPTNKCFIIWDKLQPEGISFAMAEYAWASFDKVAKICKQRTQGQEQRFHPTQKPIKLYEWLLMNYAEKGDKILDTHLGSGSIAIACDKTDFDLVACELDTGYYNKALKRLKIHQQQLTMF